MSEPRERGAARNGGRERGRGPSFRTRLFRTFGLTPMAHRPPLTWRYWIYAATAYLMPVVIQIGLPSDPSSMDELVWLLTLVPAFILSLHYGLRGAFVALLLGTGLFVTVQTTLALYYTSDDPRVTVPIYIAYGMLSISVGWLSEQLHEHYELALELQAKQKTDALGNLAAGLGHEFNNILTAMVANAELIADNAGARSPETREELDQLKAAADKGAGIVRNLLGLSRRGMLTPRPMDLPALLEDLLPTLDRLAGASVEVRVDIEPDVPRIFADQEAVEEILLNLVTNARDAMDPTGTLEIVVAPGTLSRDQFHARGWGDPGRYVRLSVSDTGIGMSEASLNQVFEPFFTTKEPGEGIGLGMAMVYGLMKQHRGYVDVESVPGHGTTVHLYFPVTREPMPSRPEEEEEAPPGGSETILVVEDEEPIRRATEHILKRFGYTVKSAADGAQAVSVYEEFRNEIDLVVCDVLLPELTGPEVYQKIRALPSPPRFLFMSGYPASNLRDRISLDPSLPFLPKPWTVEELLTAVRDVLNSDDRATTGVGGEAE
ncbi:MAG: ATP-binding protein [Longimicrobiales bacterium]|nr:ATP-binding protein [Longimicrobiales bacterium]